jgi:hypothetical protein
MKTKHYLNEDKKIQIRISIEHLRTIVKGLEMVMAVYPYDYSSREYDSLLKGIEEHIALNEEPYETD